MRNVFIVNPNAGKKGRAERLIERIKGFFSENGGDYVIHTTSLTRKGTYFAEMEAEKGDEIRIFACGGDGTVFDVVNGIAGHDNCALGVIPCGTANDFIKYFGQRSAELFSDISAQLGGTVRRIDAIKACGHYAVNVCSIGMDADVCANKDRFSRLPLIDGQAAYIMSLFYCFLHSIRNRLTVSVDGGEPKTGEYLFAVAGNGRYYGGGFMATPDAVLDNGYMDCMTIDSVSRFRIASLLKCYTKGEHTAKAFCTMKRAKKMTVTAEKETAVNMDGEIFMEKEVNFEVIPGLIRFIVPRGCEENFTKINCEQDKLLVKQ